jgi:Bacterial Ig-like domain (group 3)/FG-GAP-like repeat/FG-GAP repeat
MSARKNSLVLACFAFVLAFAPASFGTKKMFQPVQTYDSGGFRPIWTAVADVNGDGKADLLTANYCADSNHCNSGVVAVRLGNGDGTFQAAQTYDSGALFPFAIVAADINGDGKIDLIVVNAVGLVSVLLGNGDGTFQPAQLFNTAGSDPISLAIADVNGDGKPDAIVTRGNSACSGAYGSIDVLLGNGDGTFQAAQTYTSGGCGSDSIAVADVNGDGRLDLVVGNLCSFDSCEGLVSVLLGNGDGTFQAAQNYVSGNNYSGSIAVADVNEDGKPDVIVLNECINCDSGGTIGILLGNGDGSFQAPHLYSSGGYVAVQMTVGDVNQDGHSDILVINCGLKQPSCVKQHATNGKGEVGVLLGNGDGTFQPPQMYPSGGTNAGAIAAADLNGDGKLDIVATNLCVCPTGSIGVLLNATAWNTTTALASSPNPSAKNELVTFTATVSSQGSGVPTGAVKFLSNSAHLGSAKLVNGVAILKKTNLPVGTLSITAIYSGDSKSKGSTSPVLIQVVNPMP